MEEKTKGSATTMSIMLLPYDLLLNCLARVSRLYYPTLSLVSKSFRTILASPELYKVRLLLGKTESCLYVCLLSRLNQYNWFTLSWKPVQNLTSDTSGRKSTGYVLARVPSPPNPHRLSFSGLVAVGSNIYSIAESGFMSLDCRSHKWSEASSLPMKLESFSASVLDQKIYVTGRCENGDKDSINNLIIQVFDTETQIWNPELIPCRPFSGILGELSIKTTCIDGKLHVGSFWDKLVVAYNSKESKWDLIEDGEAGKDGMVDFYSPNSYCEIDNVLYVAFKGVLKWYDTKVRKWKNLEGLVGPLKFPQVGNVKLADNGGKMAVYWEEQVFDYDLHEKRIWFAEIALERCKSSQIWGNIEWIDHVLIAPKYHIVKVLAAIV